MPVQMPDPRVPPEGTDQDRGAHMADIDFGPATILEQKMMDPYTPGTAGDETGIAAEIIRGCVRRGGRE